MREKHTKDRPTQQTKLERTHTGNASGKQEWCAGNEWGNEHRSVHLESLIQLQEDNVLNYLKEVKPIKYDFII